MPQPFDTITIGTLTLRNRPMQSATAEVHRRNLRLI